MKQKLTILIVALVAALAVCGWSWPRLTDPEPTKLIALASNPFAGELQVVANPYITGSRGTVNVTGTVLRVLGASSWTGVTTWSGYGDHDRWVSITNCGTVGSVFVKRVNVGASLTGAVTASDYFDVLGPGGGRTKVLCHSNEDVAIVSDGSTVSVHAEEEVYR